MRDAVEVLLGFARTLRHAGVPASPDRVQAMLEAVGQLDVLDRGDVYWAGRATLCGNRDDLERYDAAFAAYFSGARPRRRAQVEQPRTTAPLATVPETPPDTEDMADDTSALAVQASAEELLRHRDLAELTPAEREELKRLFALLAPRVATRRSRRYAAAPRGRVDLPRTVRRMLHHAGEPARLARHAPRHKPRRLVLLIDVSGSMAPYADALLRFAHAAVRTAPMATEVFTLGTRLTRVTRELHHRDPERALRAAGAAIPDWSGGTRLGEVLKAFLDRWGQRGAARQAVVVVFSDGWERGDPSLLGEQMARLQRLAYTVAWANPHKATPGFAPLTGGMVAALPHVDTFVEGHSFAALQRLVEVIGGA